MHFRGFPPVWISSDPLSILPHIPSYPIAHHLSFNNHHVYLQTDSTHPLAIHCPITNTWMHFYKFNYINLLIPLMHSSLITHQFIVFFLLLHRLSAIRNHHLCVCLLWPVLIQSLCYNPFLHQGSTVVRRISQVTTTSSSSLSIINYVEIIWWDTILTRSCHHSDF